jgi:hypothetical protein
VVVKVLFLVLIVSTAALVAVGLAVYLRVRRHLLDSKSVQEELPETELPAQNVGPLDTGTSED